jgi:hypothetical protein
MKKTFSFFLIAVMAIPSLLAQEEDSVLVVKPLYVTTSETETNWGGDYAVIAVDPRYVLAKVEGYENSYSGMMSLNQYYKTNKWASKWGYEYTANEGWSNNHQFTIVYQGDYGTSSLHPSAITPLQSFLLESDTAVTFYAVINADNKIRAYCDMQAVAVTVSNNTAGGLVLPAQVGATSLSGALYIDGTGKIESLINNHILNPSGGTGKYAIYTRGRHVFTVDFPTLQYAVNKVIDMLQAPMVRLGTETPVNAVNLPADLGGYTHTNFPLLGGSITGISTTTSVFDVSKVNASLLYEIAGGKGEEVITGKIPLSTSATGTQTTASWVSEDGVNISEGLADGTYTLKLWYETESYGDVLTDDNNGACYSSSFAFINNLVLSNLSVSQGDLTPAFDPDTLFYTVAVATDVESIILSADVDDERFVITGHGKKELEYGDNVLDVTVKIMLDETEISNTYSVNVVRAKRTDATLSALNVSGETLSSEFDPEVLEYTVDVAHDVEAIDIVAEANDAEAVVAGIGEDFPLRVGKNEFEIIVTAHDGVTTLTYTLTVVRAKSADATLKALTVSGTALDTPFNPANLIYTAHVDNIIMMVNVTATPAHSEAIVAGDGVKSLDEGDNPFNIRVMAQDGVTEQTYQLNVIRAYSTGIDPTDSNSGIRVINGTIHALFDGETRVELYSVAGQLLNRTVATGAYSQVVGKGIYILFVAGKSYKIIVK